MISNNRELGAIDVQVEMSHANKTARGDSVVGKRVTKELEAGFVEFAFFSAKFQRNFG